MNRNKKEKERLRKRQSRLVESQNRAVEGVQGNPVQPEPSRCHDQLSAFVNNRELEKGSHRTQTEQCSSTSEPSTSCSHMTRKQDNLLNNYFEDQRQKSVQKENKKSEKVKSERFLTGMKRKCHTKGSPITPDNSENTNWLDVDNSVQAKRIKHIVSDNKIVVKDKKNTDKCFEQNVLTNVNEVKQNKESEIRKEATYRERHKDETQVKLRKRTLKANLRKRLREENEIQYKLKQRMLKADFRMRQREENDTRVKLKERAHKANSRMRQREENDTLVKLKERTLKANFRMRQREENDTQVKLKERAHKANSRMRQREENDTWVKLKERAHKANSRMRQTEENDTRVKLKREST
ncbi:DNA ligase 1-like [Ruditapes philippinarum]|uniref:DNA ligase 1-like n=1 Tax=Ruditapes philippinarum TaxID=129788 RepID=UPI00295B0C2B|nr:DNA ligase 1-like [Ruditapes philippinarum]